MNNPATGHMTGDGGKLPSYVAVCRPVVLHNKWRSPDTSDTTFQLRATLRPVPVKLPDASDTTFRLLPPLGKGNAPYGARSGNHPSEVSGQSQTGGVSAPQPRTAPVLLAPLDTPWRDGARYRMAGACEVGSRLDCYVADPAGPWIRRSGVLLAVHLTQNFGGSGP